MGTSFTEFLMESLLQMRTTELVGLMRVYGGSLGRMTAPPCMYWVCFLYIHWRIVVRKLIKAVTHGLMSRVFLMKWYHFSVEYFEDLRNINHCEFIIMRKSNDSGKYILENNLRTWSQLKEERLAAAAKEKEKEKEKEKKSLPSSSPSSPISDRDREKRKKLEAAVHAPTRKKWGGCPNGCDHGKHMFRRQNSMHAMEQLERASLVAVSPVDPRPPARRRRWQNSSDDEDSDEPHTGGPGMAIDVSKSLTDVVSSPDGTPSFISVEQRLRMSSPESNGMLVSTGRDFGGSASGNTSVAGSDTEGEGKKGTGGAEEKEELRKVMLRAGMESGMGRGAMADALGDQSDAGSDVVAGERGVEIDIRALQLEEESVQGSVY